MIASRARASPAEQRLNNVRRSRADRPRRADVRACHCSVIPSSLGVAPTGLADGLAMGFDATATAGTPADSPQRLGFPAHRV